MSNMINKDDEIQSPDIEIEGLGQTSLAEKKFGTNQPDRNLQEEYQSIQNLHMGKPQNSTPSPNKDLQNMSRSGVLGKIRQSFKLNVTSKNTESRSSSDLSSKGKSSGRRKSLSGSRKSIRKNFGPSDLEGNFNLGQSRLSLAGIVVKRVHEQENDHRESLFSKKSGNSIGSSGRGEVTNSKFGPLQSKFSLNIPSSA